VAGRNCIIPFVGDAYTPEACALWDGMSLAEAMGCNKLIVHSDSSEVIEVMRNGGNTFSTAAAIFKDCIFFCREFTEVIFEHFPREANMAADPLASKADGPLPAIWKEDPPDFLVDVILNDVSVFSNLI
jgi:hypothetical protein